MPVPPAMNVKRRSPVRDVERELSDRALNVQQDARPEALLELGAVAVGPDQQLEAAVVHRRRGRRGDRIGRAALAGQADGDRLPGSYAKLAPAQIEPDDARAWRGLQNVANRQCQLHRYPLKSLTGNQDRAQPRWRRHPQAGNLPCGRGRRLWCEAAGCPAVIPPKQCVCRSGEPGPTGVVGPAVGRENIGNHQAFQGGLAPFW